MTLAELNVKVTADIGKIQDDLDKVKKKLKDTDEVADKNKKTIGGLADKFKSLSIAGIGVTAAIGAVFVGLKKCVEAAAESEAITSKLNQVLRSTGEIAGVSSQEALELANSLSLVTTFEDDTIVSAESMLLTFTRIGEDVFPQATEATLDLATMMGGDLNNAAIMLGKALNDPIQGVGALRRVGVQLSAEQENQVRKFMAVNDVASAQKIILGELATEMGGQARAATQTYAGQMAQLKNQIGEAEESIGKLLLPVLSKVVTQLKHGAENWNIFFEKMKWKSDIDKGLESTNEELKEQDKELNKLNSTVKINTDLNKFLYTNNLSNTLKTAEKTKEVEKAKTILTKEQIEAREKAEQEYVTKRETQYNTLIQIDQEYQNKILEQSGNGKNLLYLQEEQALMQLDQLTTIADTTKEQARTNISKYYANQRRDYEKKTALETAQTVLSTISGLNGQLSGLFSMYYSNKGMLIDNDKVRQQTAIDETYQKEKAAIENSSLDEETKTAKLKALDEKYARDKQTLDEKVEKQKRKLQREAAKNQKAISIVDAIINTARGVTAALGMFPPPVAWAMAAINAALGAAQVALIKAQPLPVAAKGGLATSPTIFGEAGAELAVPLESTNGQKAIRSFASGLLDEMSASVDTRATTERVQSGAGQGGGNVYLDGSLVGKWLTRGSDNGAFRINKMVVV